MTGHPYNNNHSYANNVDLRWYRKKKLINLTSVCDVHVCVDFCSFKSWKIYHWMPNYF